MFDWQRRCTPNIEGKVPPKTRKALFRQVFCDRILNLVPLNMCYLLFWLPTIVLTCIFVGVLVLSESAEMSNQLRGLYLALLFPCIAITGPGRAGIVRVVREIACDCYLGGGWSILGNAVKENWKQALTPSAISGTIPLLMFISWDFYFPKLCSGSFFSAVPLSILCCATLVWLLSQPCLYHMLVTYELPLSAQICNAVLLTLKKGFHAAGILLLERLPPVLLIMLLSFMKPTGWPAAMLSSVLLLYYLAAGLAVNQLLNESFANWICEMEINVKIPGAHVDIGLASEREIPGNGGDHEQILF